MVVVVMLCLGLAAASIALQGFRLNVDNNAFHLPIVLGWYNLPQFADDPFIQSLRNYATPLYPLLSLISTEQNVSTVFLVAHGLTRALTFYAGFQVARAIGLAPMASAAATTVVALSTAAYGVTAIGRDELLINLFTHTALAQAVALLAIAWVIRGEMLKACLAAGLAFDLNLMVGVWTLVPIAFAYLHSLRLHPAAGALAMLRGAAVFLLTASPVVVWLLLTQRFEPATFDYRAYLADYYPFHFFIGWSSWPARLTTAAQLASGLLALSFLPERRRIAAAALLGLAGVVAVGVLIGQVSSTRFLLNLHLIRADGLMLWLVLLLVGGALCTVIAGGRRLLLPGAMVSLAGLMAGLWPAVLAGLAAMLMAKLTVRHWAGPWPAQRVPSPWPHLAAALLVLLITATGGRYSGGPLPLTPGAAPTDDQLAGASPSTPEWLQVTGWARQQTAADAIFLVPWKLDFVAGAKRRSWVGWKEGAAAMWAPETYPIWRRRGDEVRALPTVQAQLAYACRHHIQYVVLDRRPERSLPGAEQIRSFAYSNRWFAVVSTPDCGT